MLYIYHWFNAHTVLALFPALSLSLSLSVHNFMTDRRPNVQCANCVWREIQHMRENNTALLGMVITKHGVSKGLLIM